MSEKFIGYFRLIDACDRDGCLVCRSVEEDGRRHLDALMYEQVTDAATRHRLRASWGFCNWHTWMLLEVPSAASGAAIIYEDLTRTVAHRVRRLAGRSLSASPLRALARLARRRPRSAFAELYRRRLACPVCAWSAAAEENYLLTLVRFIDDPQFARAYARSAGVCLPHLLDAAARSAGAPGLSKLLSRTLAKWEELRSDLDRFVSKHDYRNREPFTDAEASSYRRAFEVLAGRRGVYGNDLHGGTPGAAVGPPPLGAAVSQPAAEDETFERGKLELRVKELTAQLNETMSRAAALHYRLSRVAEDRDALELNLSGERGANELAMRTLVDLRAENERLRAELAAARGQPVAGPRREA